MPNSRRLLVTGAAVLLAGLVAMLPARVAHRWLSPAAVQLAGIEGSAWHGSAAEALIGGAYLRNLRWSWRPLTLLTGRLGYRLEAEPPGGFLDTELAVGVGGGVNVDSLRAALPLAALGGALPLGGISGGEVTLQLSDVRIVDGWPTRLSGEARVSQLLVPDFAPVPVGDYLATDLHMAEAGLVGSVEDASGMLDVAGTVTLTPELSYRLDGLVGTTPQATASVAEQLRVLGTPDDRGLRPFTIEGRLELY